MQTRCAYRVQRSWDVILYLKIDRTCIFQELGEMVHLDGLTCTDSDSGDSGSEPESCNESEESYTIHSEDGVSDALSEDGVGDAISEDEVGGVTLGKVVVVFPAVGLRFISQWALEDMAGKP